MVEAVTREIYKWMNKLVNKQTIKRTNVSINNPHVRKEVE